MKEGLDNARKHAPSSTVALLLRGSPRQGLTVEVANALGDRRRAAPSGRPGTGLIGLAERVEIAGGRLEHGPGPDNTFVLRGWLPWSD